MIAGGASVINSSETSAEAIASAGGRWGRCKNANADFGTIAVHGGLAKILDTNFGVGTVKEFLINIKLPELPKHWKKEKR